MATEGMVVDAFVDHLKTALSGVITDSVYVADGWPSLKAISEIPKSRKSLVGVYIPVSMPKPGIRPRRVAQEIVLPGIASSVSVEVLSPGQQTAITLSYAENSTAVKDKDAVSFVAHQANVTNGVVAKATASSTLQSLAAALASEINSAYPGAFTAVAAGAVVTVSNISLRVYRLYSYTGNVGIRSFELARKLSDMRISTWHATYDNRRAIGDALEIELAKLRRAYGLKLSNGESIRIEPAGRYIVQNDADVPADVVRLDFFVQLEIPISTIDEVYSVLVPGKVLGNF